MNKAIISFFLILIVVLALGINCKDIKLYEPDSPHVNITVSEVETGNKLIDITEVNIILLLMVVGAFLIIR